MNGPALGGAACTIRVNGEDHEIAMGTSLAALLERLEHAPAAVATAVDGTFVAREKRASCVLQAGAQVHCFQPIVGG